jgi:conjugative transfer signal peptidase TraF
MSPLDNGNRWSALGVAVFALGCIAAAAAQTQALALVNESPSLPKGLYIRLPGVEPARGKTVAAPQPEIGRAYLAGMGAPAEIVLIKRVGAAGGDLVCVRGDRVWTPGGVHDLRRRDRRGVALPSWSGCRRLTRDELFLLGDTAESFDSRYFGPVSRSAVLGVYREVLTW